MNQFMNYSNSWATSWQPQGHFRLDVNDNQHAYLYIYVDTQPSQGLVNVGGWGSQLLRTVEPRIFVIPSQNLCNYRYMYGYNNKTISEFASVVNGKSDSVRWRCDTCDANLCARVKRGEMLMARVSSGLRPCRGCAVAGRGVPTPGLRMYNREHIADSTANCLSAAGWSYRYICIYMYVYIYECMST